MTSHVLGTKVGRFACLTGVLAKAGPRRLLGSAHVHGGGGPPPSRKRRRDGARGFLWRAVGPDRRVDEDAAEDGGYYTRDADVSPSPHHLFVDTGATTGATTFFGRASRGGTNGRTSRPRFLADSINLTSHGNDRLFPILSSSSSVW